MGRWVSVGGSWKSLFYFLISEGLFCARVEVAELVTFASLPLNLDGRLFRSEASDACLYA